ncbi:hypothetical protein GCM10010302_17360 [Streptomyces polychromogenes]|uniref:Uncharacterized protein n=1 Tax=Streptomyces polychromogenes TaxID=67342 RepID=A0ABP3EVT7_9ACTN
MSRLAQGLGRVPPDPLALGRIVDLVLDREPIGQLDWIAGQVGGPAFERVGGGELVAGHHQRPPGLRQVSQGEAAGQAVARAGHRVGDELPDPAVGVRAAQDEPGDRLRRVEGLAGGVHELGGQRLVGVHPGAEKTASAPKSTRAWRT